MPNATPDAPVRRYALPTARLVLAGLVPGALGAVGVSLVSALAGLNATPALLGGLAAAAALVIPGAVARPWTLRREADWFVLMLVWQGLSLVGVLAIGLPLYSAAPAGPARFWLTLAGGFVVGLIAQAVVYSNFVRAQPRQRQQ
ncbi:MAG: hypothetical protein AAGI30_03355 [Planctomycetota bacterium]